MFDDHLSPSIVRIARLARGCCTKVSKSCQSWARANYSWPSALQSGSACASYKTAIHPQFGTGKYFMEVR